MISAWLKDVVDVTAPGEYVANDGTVTDDWTLPVLVGSYAAVVQGLTGTEELGERDGSRARFRVYMQSGAPTDHRTRLVWRGRTPEVVSVPRTVYDLSGVASHLEITVKEVLG